MLTRWGMEFIFRATFMIWYNNKWYTSSHGQVKSYVLLPLHGLYDILPICHKITHSRFCLNLKSHTETYSLQMCIGLKILFDISKHNFLFNFSIQVDL